MAPTVIVKRVQRRRRMVNLDGNPEGIQTTLVIQGLM